MGTVPRSRRSEPLRAERVDAAPSGRLRSFVDLQGSPRGPLALLFGLNLVDEFDHMTFATLTPEIRDAFSLTDQQVVAIGAVSSVFVLVSAVPIGYLADRMSRVRMARVAAVVWGSMAVLLGLAWAVPVLFLARFFAGAAKSSNEIVHTSLLADLYPPRAHGRVFQLHRLANPLSQVSALAAGGIGALLGWRWAFILLAIPTFGLLSGLARLREPHRGESIDAEAARAAAESGVGSPPFRQVVRLLLAIPSMRRLWGGIFIVGIGALAIDQMLSLFFDEVYGFGPLGRGVVAFVWGAGNVLGIVVGGQLGARRTAADDFAGLGTVIAGGLAAFALGVVLIAASPFAAMSVAAGLVAAGGVGAIVSVLPTILVRIVQPTIRAQAHALATLSLAVGGLFAIPLAGLGDGIGYRLAFGVLAVVVACGALVTSTMRGTLDGDVEAADAALRAAV